MHIKSIKIKALSYSNICILKILGIKPLFWHVYIIFGRWVSGCLFYILLRKIIPQHKSIALCAGLIYIVFPGFGGNSIAFIYSFFYVVISSVLLSLIFMRESITRKKGRGYFLLLALLFEAVHLFVIEYFIGIELARVFVIYVILISIQSDGSKLINFSLFKMAFRYSLPYLSVFVIYLIYHVFFFTQSSLPETNQALILHSFFADPIHGILTRVGNLISDIVSLTIFLWTQCFSQDFFGVGAKVVFALSLGITLIFYLKTGRNSENNDEAGQPSRKRLSLLLMLLGLILILFGELPIFVIKKSINLSSHGIGDRFSLPEIIGACIFMTAALHYFISERIYLTYSIAILTAAGCAYQFSVSKTFTEENSSLKNFYRQLSWRIPEVEKDTYFMMSANPAVNSTSASYSYSFAINAIYGRNEKMGAQNYWLTNLGDIKDSNPNLFEQNVPVEFKLRSYGFKGNTSKTVTLFSPEKGCLRVVDSANIVWLGADPNTNLAGALTNIKLIKDTSVSKNDFLDKIYGHEDKNCWCYYFEKMELAQQNNNWKRAQDMINKGIAKNLKPENDVEWVSVLGVALKNNEIELAKEIVVKDINSKQARSYAFKMLTMLRESDMPSINQLLNELKSRKSKEIDTN